MNLSEKLKKAVRYPRRVPIEIHGLFHDVIFWGSRGINIPQADWDNLIILDACRFDLFEAQNSMDGELSAARSRGTHTGQFMERNFGGLSFPDTVYVSANPNPAQVGASFHDIVPLWESAWDEELQTVSPEAVVKATMKAAENYPDKRLIIHFLQPHYPWIGPEGRRYMEEHSYWPQTQSENVWTRLRRGDVSKHEIWAVYQENLEVTLPHVETIVEELSGKSVVTSDHGNAFGEWDVYGHPGSTYIEPLVRVPWFVADWEERKHIVSGSASQSLSSLQGSVDEEHLEALGYME